MVDRYLSVCIPTFNRSNWLSRTIESIVSEPGFDERIEIVVSDNASTDSTPALMELWCKRHSNIRYHRLAQNVGFDRNIIQVLTLACGEYCWLLGDDDKLTSGALCSVLEDLATSPDLLLFNRVNCDAEQNPRRNESWLKMLRPQRFDFSQEQVQIEYLHNACSLGALFSFISSLVVRRDALHLREIAEEVLRTGYVHVFLMLRDILGAGKVLLYDPRFLVLCRWPAQADSKISLAAFRQDAESYSYFFAELFGYNPALQAELYAVLRRSHPLTKLLFLFSQFPEECEDLSRLATVMGYSERQIYWVKVVAKSGVLRLLLGRLHRIVRAVRRGV